MKYSVWVIPQKPVADKLKSIVNNLASKYDGPIFEPHMTILGGVDKKLEEIKEKIENIANITQTLELSFGPVSFSTTYFQNVLIRINSTAQLMELNMMLKKRLNVVNDVFMPHISLLYGNQSMEIREKAAKDIEPIKSSFKVSELVVTPSTANPSEWVHSAVIPLISN